MATLWLTHCRYSNDEEEMGADWNYVDRNADGYAPYVQYQGSFNRGEERNALIFAAEEVFW